MTTSEVKHPVRSIPLGTGKPKRGVWKSLLWTIGASPLLALVWGLNGLFSVKGLPQAYNLFFGPIPEFLEKPFFWAGWGFVVVSSWVEIEILWKTLKGRPISFGLGILAAFFWAYDVGTTGLGFYQMWDPKGMFWVVLVLATLIVTNLVETILTLIWKEA